MASSINADSDVTFVTKTNNIQPGSTVQATQPRVVSVGPGPGKMRIDPLQLLTCLRVLLDSNGGIKSIEEVQRVAGLMGKYSKKLVSKCIYLNILEATDAPLLDEFYRETGWNLVGSWLTEAISTKNYPLAQQILSLLLQSPVSIERLKKNNTPKMVKDLSKDCPYEGVRDIAEKVVQRWKELVKSTCSTVSGPGLDLSALNATLEVSGIVSAPALTVPAAATVVSTDIVNSGLVEAIEGNCNIGPVPTEASVTSASADVRSPPPPEPIDADYVPETDEADHSLDEDYVPSPRVGRKRGSSKSTKGGMARGRGRRKRGSSRGRGRGSLSYADLLCQDLQNADEETHSQSSHDTDDDSDVRVVTSPEKPFKITISRGSKRGQRGRGGKRHRVSIDSTDSEDNKPLSIIRNECQFKSDSPVEMKEEDDEEKEGTVDGKNIASETISEKINEKEEEVEKEDSEKNVSMPIQEDGTVQEEIDNDKKMKRSDSLGSTKSDVSSDSDFTDAGHKKKEESREKAKKEKHKKKDLEEEKKSEEKSKDKTSKDKRREEDRRRERNESSSDSNNLKDKERDKERSKTHKDKHRRDHDKHRDKDRKNSRDGHREKDKNRDLEKHKDEDRRERKRDPDDEKKRKREQAEKDKATLDKVKPLSTEGLGKIPRKAPPGPISFLDALGSADTDFSTDAKRPAVKTKSRGFRNTGLLDETIKPPGIAGKRSSETKAPTAAPPSVPATFKRPHSSSSSAIDTSPSEKKSKLPSGLDRPGGIKLISPKRPTLADDGGFMAALTAAGESRKKIVRKRKSSEGDSKTEQVAPKTPKTEKGEDGQLKAEVEEGPSVDKESPEGSSEDSVMKAETDQATLSPTSIKPTFNFYKETLKDPDDTKPSSSGKSTEGEDEGSAESSDKEETTAKRKSEDIESEPDSPKSPPEEAPAGEKAEDDSMEIDDSDENGDNDDLCKAPVPAPSQEEYDKIKIEVTFSKPSEALKSVLVYHRPANKPRKAVRWKIEEELSEVYLFPMDETERVNVNTIKFKEMMLMEKATEKELMLGKHRLSARLLHDPYALEAGICNTCVDYGPYKLYPVHLPVPSKVVPACKSLEKHVQAQREHATMATFFHPAMLPDSPAEPDSEMVPREEVKVIPKEDVNGSGTICDNRMIPWPEPLFEPPEFPFMSVGPPPPPLPPPSAGGHWVPGNQSLNRFNAGPLYGGPSNNPASHQAGFHSHGFPPGDMRTGGWAVPHDFGGPPLMIPNGPGMMGPGPLMQGGPPMQGPNMGGSGPGMGMGINMGGPPMSSGGGNQRYRRGGGGDRGGSWRGSQNRRQICRHFRMGNCRHGSDCKYLHTYD